MKYSFKLDVNGEREAVEKHWQFCIGSCHAALAIRADYLEQLEMAHKELGFQRVRFHGLFNNDMNVCQTLSEFIPVPNGRKVRTDNFYQIGVIYDRLLKIGIKPFVELSFMPRALASGRRTVFHYKGNITQPKDYEKWAEFIRSFIKFLIDRYGIEEVSQWYYEVWNEPDLFIFFKGKQKDYFKLYDYTVKAIKGVDPRLMVGGPSTSGNRWVKDLKEYCIKNCVPLDFLSTHHYPGDACGHKINLKVIFDILFMKKRGLKKSINQTLRELLFDQSALSRMEKGILTKQAKKAKEEAGDIPLYYTEWNANSTCTAPVHDTIQSAAFAVKTCLDNQGVINGSSFWTFSDIFEELFFFPEPFSGNFGLMNIHGIKKPSFWAFKLLASLPNERYKLDITNDEVEIAAFYKEDEIKIMMYFQEYNLTDKQHDVELNININNVKEIFCQLINQDSGNPIAIWKGMGSPLNLTEAQVEYIKKESEIKIVNQDYIKSHEGIALNTTISSNEVKLFSIKLNK